MNQVADLKIAELDGENIGESDKIGVRNNLNHLGDYVNQLNSGETTQAIRQTFKSFYQAGIAAEYIQDTPDAEMSTYDPQTVKSDAIEGASELREMDENMGIGFMTMDYEKLSNLYEEL